MGRLDGLMAVMKKVRKEVPIVALLPVNQPHSLVLAKCGVKVTGRNILIGYFCGQCRWVPSPHGHILCAPNKDLAGPNVHKREHVASDPLVLAQRYVCTHGT